MATDAWIRFMAPVNPQSCAALINAIDIAIQERKERIHLMLSSPGGSVFHGLSIYNLLRGTPIEVITYNFGTVDSIGVVIFCAGAKRVTVPHSRFLIHGVSLNVGGNQSWDEKDLEERLKGLQIDYLNIARVIADTAKRDVESVMDDMNSRTTLDPNEAKVYGLVHEVRSELFPIDANVIAINEDVGVKPAIGGIHLPVQHMSAPLVQSFTDSFNNHSGTYF